MADNVTIPASGTGTATPVVATDDVGGVHYQRMKVDGGGDGASTPILAGGGVEASALRVTIASDSTGVVSVDDNGSTLSVDDGGGNLSIDDGGNSITVDNGGTFAVQVDGSALTALQLIDDIVYTDDTSTHSTGSSKGALLMAAATPTDGSVNANDIGAVAMTTDRKLHVSVQDALPAGTNAIGKLAANSGVDIGDVDVTSQPARAATTDTITAKLATDTIQNGTTALTPKFAAIAAASSGDNTLVAAVVGKKIRVLSLMLMSAGSVNIYFTSAAAGTVIFGGSTNKINLVANTGFVLPFAPIGWMENSSTNQALVLNLSAAVAVSGGLTYIEV